MPTQQTFLGASIISYTGNIGWGYNPSTLNVTLVEDPVNLDDFTPVAVGTPVQFKHVSDTGFIWRFNGLVQNYKYNRGSSGFIYTVTLQDPRETLDGVQVILGGFAETVSIKNVLNVYGHLENINFGHSERNAAGIPWKKVRDAVVSMCNSTGNYGSGIYLRGNRYELDLSRLPNIDENFRVGGSDQLTLMDFISEVCEAGSHDYFIDLEDPTTNGFSGKIVIGTVSRNSNPTPGLLTNYLSTVTGVVSSEAGLEFRNDVVGKFLVGPQIIEMYGQSKAFEDTDTFVVANIKPFWGFDEKYEMLKGTSLQSVFGNNHVVKIDSRHLRVPGLENYYLEIGELRAAYDSQSSWLNYLESRKGSGTYSSADYTKPHEGKLELVATELVGYPQGQGGATPSVLQMMQKNWMTLCAEAKENDSLEKTGRVYNFVKSYADQYYGTKFAVQLPDIKITREPESLTYRTSKIPADAGFFLPAQWSGAIDQNRLPHSYTRLMNEEGRFYPYVRYDGIEFLDFNEVPQSEMVFNSGRTSVFIKCGVENGVAFGDIAISGEPHAVISLPGPVRKLNDKTDFGRRIIDLVASGEGIGKFAAGSSQNISKKFGIDTVWDGDIAAAAMPNYVCIPLQDNENRYGPWWNVQANGRMEYETDDSLAPWNYGGYELLDRVAFAKVSQMDSTMCESESGSMEIAGTPQFTMGQQLVSGGPYITDIQVSIGQDGVKTTYQFATWSPRIQKLGRSRLDKIDRIAKLSRGLSNRQIAKTNKFENRTFSNLDRQLNVEQTILKTTKPKQLGGNTSHGIFSGDADILYDNQARPSSIVPNCWVQPFYNFAAQVDEDKYRAKAAVSVDGLFRPFSTHPSGVNYGLPSFINPTYSGGDPTVNHLNPYKGNHDITTVIRGSSMPPHLCTMYDSGYVNETDYRSMGLKGPLVIVGPGYDTEGYPVPNESGHPFNSGTRTQNFYPNYRQRQDLWPAGPLDARWDRNRGVWVAGGGSKSKIVKLIATSGIFPNGFNKVYLAEEMSMLFNNEVGTTVTTSGTGNTMYVGNFRHNIASSGGIYVAHEVNGKYFIDNQLTFFGGIV